MKKVFNIIVLGLSIAFIIFGGTTAFMEPGSEADPLVSKSFVEKKIEELMEYIDQKVNGSNSSVVEGAWAVVEVPEGKSLICYGGTEIILRSGRATAISIVKSGIENGVTDVTAGRDLKMNEEIEQNHLLIIPRTDSRGAYSVTHTYWLVKGDYEIK
ncbi:MAG: hypothetical protein GX077_00815 [Tissierellia bacterium]|nr:hypothetical protein [Tissierellia bacterium]